MRIDVLTLFPSMFSSLNESIIGKAREKGIIKINIHNIRDNTKDKHGTADDAPYGGGAGMVMKAEPIIEALGHLKKENTGSKVILMSPSGRRLDHKMIERLSADKGLIIICGHYEGVDDRVRSRFVDEEVSIGDYVLTGGELPAMVLIDAVSRLMPGVLGDDRSSQVDSFADGFLEGPHFTRPEDISGMGVPKVLLSGNHREIDAWRRKMSLEKTLFERPELFVNADVSKEDTLIMNSIITGEGK